MKTLRTLKVLSTLLLLLCFSITYSNPSEVFKVLAATGDVQIQKSGSNAEWETIASGTKLFSDDKLKISGLSYVGLIHSSGKTMELKKAGTYKVSDLAQNITPGSEGVSQKFVDYMINAIAKVDDPSNLSNYQGYMTVTGSVERSLVSKDVKVFMPKATNVMNQEVTFIWYDVKNMDKYIFNLMDRYARPIFEKELADTSITIDLSQFNLDPENCYFWNVYCKKEPKIRSDEFCLVMLSEDSKNSVKETLQKLTSELGDNESALNKVVIASFYEQNNLVNEANNYYEDAIEKAPQVDDYKKAYALFLIKMRLFDKAKMVWKK
ncbi:hypothetical protein JYT51_02500 [Candidatus Amoebophilus asiaticus]|nr:hypothetical protein [Candidatus Amoebophilus asiaticus]